MPPATGAVASGLPALAGLPGLHALPGIDVAAGVRRLAGNRALYDRLLKRFAVDWRHAASRLEELISTGARGDGRRLAHTLKGTSATLGIDEVSRVAATIEAALSGTF